MIRLGYSAQLISICSCLYIIVILKFCFQVSEELNEVRRRRTGSLSDNELLDMEHNVDYDGHEDNDEGDEEADNEGDIEDEE